MAATPLTDLIATRSRTLDFSAFGLVLPNPDPILKAQGRDITTYRDLKTDAHVGGCIRRRKAAVKALEHGIDRDRAPSRIAKSIESILGGLDLDRIIGEMMDAVLYGYQPLEIAWQRVGSLLVPGDVVGKPPEWFCFDPDNQLRLKTRANPQQGELLPAKKFLLPRQDATYQNPYGFPDLSMCFWPVFFKKGGVKLWLQFTEKFGSAFAVGQLPRNAQPQERDEMLEALTAMLANSVATIPDDGSVKLLEMSGKSASADLYERLAMFCRSEVSIALTGTNQTTEANSNKASATAGLDVARDLRDGDAGIVAAALNQLIRWTVELNWPAAEPPIYDFWDQEAQDALQASRDKSNFDAGARFTNAYFMRAYGYQEGDLLPNGTASAPLASRASLQAATPSFAEEDLPTDPGQSAIDAALDNLPGGAIDTAMKALLEPLARQLQAGATPDEAGDWLLSGWPDMDRSALAEILARAMFVADLWGRLDAQQNP